MIAYDIHIYIFLSPKTFSISKINQCIFNINIKIILILI